MISIGQKIKQIREERGLSQGDIERASGMLRGYISRVEHGHTVPSIETLERFAGALGVPMFKLFCGFEGASAGDLSGQLAGSQDGEFLTQLNQCLQRMPPPNRELLLDLARRLAARQ